MTQIKPMKLAFSRGTDTWDKVITTLDGTIIYEDRGIVLFQEFLTKEYFDGWEKQIRQAPWWNIVEVERFI